MSMDIWATAGTPIIGLPELGVFPRVELASGWREDGNHAEADTTTPEAAGDKAGKAKKPIGL